MSKAWKSIEYERNGHYEQCVEYVVVVQFIASAPLFIIGWGMLIYGVVELLNAFKVSNNKRIWLKNQQQKQNSKEIYVDVEEVKNEE